MSGILIPFRSDHFSLHQLSDGVFAAIATTGGSAVSNAAIIDLGGRTLVFDTLLTPQAGQDLRRAALQLTGREPGMVVNSHYHNDHIWGNQAFDPQTLFISTARTLKLMHTDGVAEVQWARDVSAGRLADAQQQLQAAATELERSDARSWIGYFGGLVQALPGLQVRFPDITFEHQLTIRGSARSVELIEFENCHTGSDAILLLRDAGILFMADLLFVGCHPYLDEADVSSLRLALEELLDIGVTTFVPGHGPLGTSQDLVSNIRYIDMCVETARTLVSQGRTSPEGLAAERPSAPFAGWGLSRFFTANLESLCSRLAETSSAD